MNPSIRQIAPLQFLGESYWPNSRFGGIYRPLTILSFSTDFALWKAWAPGFRLTNLLLHALNGWLVFLLAQSLVGRLAAWAATAVYLAHPVHTEAVVSIVGRSELLAAFFVFSAWLLFRKGRTGLSAVAFFLALLSKESAIIFPLVLVLERALAVSGPPPATTSTTKGVSIRSFVPLALVAFAYLALRFKVLGGVGIPLASQYVHGVPLVQRWLTAGRVFLQYLRLVVVPIDVAGSYEFASIPAAHFNDWDAWLGIFLVGAIIVFGIRLVKIRPVITFAILFFFVALLPVSNVIMPIGAIMAERFLYTPLFAAALLAGLLWTKIQSKRVRLISGSGFMAIAILFCLSHNLIWFSDYTFFGNMVRVVPDNVTGRLGYGEQMRVGGRIDDAKEQFEAGLKIAPEHAYLLTAMASLISRNHPEQCDQARTLINRSLKNEPDYWESYWALANCSVQEGKPEEAVELYRQAAEKAPVPDANLLYSWARTLEGLERRDAAIEVYQRAVALTPEDREIQRRLAALQRQKGDRAR